MKFRYKCTDMEKASSPVDFDYLTYSRLAEDRSISQIVNDGDADLLLQFCPYVRDNFELYGFMNDHPKAQEVIRKWFGGPGTMPKVLDSKTYYIK